MICVNCVSYSRYFNFNIFWESNISSHLSDTSYSKARSAFLINSTFLFFPSTVRVNYRAKAKLFILFSLSSWLFIFLSFRFSFFEE